MGNTQATLPDPRFASATRAFTQKELEDLKSIFVSLAAQSQSGGQYISTSVFQGPLGERLFDLLTNHRKDSKLTFEDLVIAKSVYEKGSNDEIEEFIYQLMDVTGDGVLKRSDLESVLIAILGSIFSIGFSEPGSSSSQHIVDVFLKAATFDNDVQGTAEKSMSFEEFKIWCTLVPSARKFLGSLLMTADAGRPGSQIPKLLYGENMDPSLLLMRKEYAWHIAGALSQPELEGWKLLYHSATNGLSFNTFIGNLSTCDGSTVLIVKDREGHIYGGYASQPWERHGDFYGDMKSFLFQLYPKASIFKPTGANHNIQWCAVNFSSENIPNGIGFGGRASHLGLFLSASLDVGHTFSCTTFGSPCLSKTNHIYPEVIECWGIVQNGAHHQKQDAVSASAAGSVLQRFKEDRHMLNMVGLAANSSE